MITISWVKPKQPKHTHTHSAAFCSNDRCRDSHHEVLSWDERCVVVKQGQASKLSKPSKFLVYKESVRKLRLRFLDGLKKTVLSFGQECRKCILRYQTTPMKSRNPDEPAGAHRVAASKAIHGQYCLAIGLEEQCNCEELVGCQLTSQWACSATAAMSRVADSSTHVLKFCKQFWMSRISSATQTRHVSCLRRYFLGDTMSSPVRLRFCDWLDEQMPLVVLPTWVL